MTPGIQSPRHTSRRGSTPHAVSPHYSTMSRHVAEGRRPKRMKMALQLALQAIAERREHRLPAYLRSRIVRRQMGCWQRVGFLPLLRHLAQPARSPDFIYVPCAAHSLPFRVPGGAALPSHLRRGSHFSALLGASMRPPRCFPRNVSMAAHRLMRFDDPAPPVCPASGRTM